jgi:hypothetical protein
MILIKTVSEKSEFEIENAGGVKTCLSWERLRPYIANAIALKPSERIVGYKVDDNGITVCIDKKLPDDSYDI